jgi:hypothetical protein
MPPALWRAKTFWRTLKAAAARASRKRRLQPPHAPRPQNVPPITPLRCPHGCSISWPERLRLIVTHAPTFALESICLRASDLDARMSACFSRSRYDQPRLGPCHSTCNSSMNARNLAEPLARGYRACADAHTALLINVKT